LRIIILSGAIGKGGNLLFEKQVNRQKEGVFHMIPSINLSPYMALRLFEDIKTYFTLAFAERKESLGFPDLIDQK